jgi:murein DD-endopeptidase MepM/ murein hydrolase activator NlpD
MAPLLVITLLFGALIFTQAQGDESFEAYMKQEQAKFQKYVEDEQRKFEAFVNNEKDWNKEILGYAAETPVSTKVDNDRKDEIEKPSVPSYVDTKTTLKKELVQITKKAEKQIQNNQQVVANKPDKTSLEMAKPSTSGIKKTTQNNKESLIEAELSYIPSLSPIKAKYRLSSKFGNRFHPTLFRWQFHNGVDMACPTGTSIYAPANGLVVKAGWSKGYGNYIKIKHGNGYETVYGHLSKISVKNGQKLKKGHVIGQVGSTGQSTGPHLHYEVLKNNKRVNPSGYLG